MSVVSAIFGTIAGLFGLVMLYYGASGIVGLVGDWNAADGQDVFSVAMFNIVGAVSAFFAVRWIRRPSAAGAPAPPMIDPPLSGMRLVATILAFVVGGVIAGAIGSAAAFYGLFGILRVISWLAGSDEPMFFMWYSMLIVPLVGLSLFGGGGFAAAVYVADWLKGRDRKGFEVVIKDGPRDAG